MQSDDEAYWAVGNVFAVITFIISWVYCIFHYGFLLGVGLGWLPSLICAAFARVVWPLLLLAIIWVAGMLFRGSLDL